MQIPLTSESIRSHLATDTFGWNIILKDSLPSTNDLAKQEDFAHGSAVLAEEQTAGKGRLGRNWMAPKGSSILMTIVLRPEREIQSMQIITLASGIAVVEAIRELYLLPARLKWPNDLTIYERKVCGILVESQLRGDGISKILVGLGCNVNQHPADFPDDLRMPATSLKIDANRELDRNELTGHILNHFEERYNQVLDGQSEKIVNDWKKNSNQLGRNVRWLENDNERTGVLRDISPDGAAVVEFEDGSTEEIISGDLL
ncbi:MAG: biotin--[acetyl-CoA-carboxylase] ligase [Candidatus Marinimicrobia bacterium]|nr:biotin--[acetyl-CoA-carboxylase] ligase [Candidatus Neomarinimicrobiota bacterium]MCF7827894.1 biotin--[acetyl-CoA-carboxylase] ligase [Candidatus Neomarinimicrobiota bacterium]MCF7879351.1 biotin--[acetyl-CoA-carboxylase] ligase [Candidatus Neomarinimicrobiota bacterium]